MGIIGDAVSYFETGRHFSNSELTVLASYADAKRESDRMRREATRKRLAVYHDDWQKVLLTRLQSMFVPENYVEIVKVFDVSNNPLKRIIEELSNIYVKPAAWTFGTKNPLWAEILAGAQAEIVFPEINKLTNLCNECFVLVAPVCDTLKFRLITPDNLIVWQDPEDPSRPIAVAYRQGMQETPGAVPRWHYWSRGENPMHEISTGDEFNDKAGHIVLREPNPYVDDDGRSVLPGVMYHRAPAFWHVFDATGGDDIYELTILVGCAETWINHIIRTDSLALKYATGQLDSRGGGIASALGIMEFVGANGNPVSVGQFQAQSNYEAIGKQITRKLNNALANYGLSMADFDLSGNPASGFALLVRKQGLIERRERQVPLYRTFDLELYDITASVWNFERTNKQSDIAGDPLPWAEECEPHVEYAEFQTTLTVQERQIALETRQVRLSMGLESIVDIYLSEHPGVTEADAEAALLFNAAKNRELLAGSMLIIGRASVLPIDQQAIVAPGPGQTVPASGAAGLPGAAAAAQQGAAAAHEALVALVKDRAAAHTVAVAEKRAQAKKDEAAAKADAAKKAGGA